MSQKHHCRICEALWFDLAEPKLNCHKLVTFGCQLCINYQLERSAWDWLHGKDFKQPRCGDCRTPMIICCWDERWSEIEFGCPREDGGGNMICGDGGLITLTVGINKEES